jgi:hypothetical protein
MICLMLNSIVTRQSNAVWIYKCRGEQIRSVQITLTNSFVNFQTIVRGPTEGRSNRENGIPRMSNVARSNSLRSSSPTRMRHLAASVRPNVPQSVPEGEVMGSAPPSRNNTPSLPANMPPRNDLYRMEQPAYPVPQLSPSSQQQPPFGKTPPQVVSDFVIFM